MMMKQRNLLANFEYKSYNLIGVVNNQSFKLQEKNQLPSLEIKIDFAAGKLAVQADSELLLQSTSHMEQRYLLAYKKRVQIQMDIFPHSVIDLNDSSNDDLLLPLEGDIMDASILNSCTGWLVLKNEWSKQDSHLWRLALYIYDHSSDYGEIKFDLPLYLVKEFQMN